MGEVSGGKGAGAGGGAAPPAEEATVVIVIKVVGALAASARSPSEGCTLTSASSPTSARAASGADERRLDKRATDVDTNSWSSPSCCEHSRRQRCVCASTWNQRSFWYVFATRS